MTENSEEDEEYIDGLRLKKTRAAWNSMISRCRKHKNYHGRGIKVCERWLFSFWDFLKDMGLAPLDKTLERKNNNGNYCKSNCKWADWYEQNNNKRNSKDPTIKLAKIRIKQILLEFKDN